MVAIELFECNHATGSVLKHETDSQGPEILDAWVKITGIISLLTVNIWRLLLGRKQQVVSIPCCQGWT